MIDVTIVIPAKNEEHGLANLLPQIRELHPEIDLVVVDDGSTDSTVDVARSLGARVISHKYSKGNGAAIKTGVRSISSKYVLCMDADGQHKAEDIAKLLNYAVVGYDMVVAARVKGGQASVSRYFANTFYNRFASWIVGHKVSDLTSGYRLFERNLFLEFVSLIPNKFSYPTTITMAFFRSGYSVGYLPVRMEKRIENTISHVSPVKDGIRFLLIIFKIGTLYSPLKIFMPVSLIFFLSGFLYYFITYLSDQRFTNMGALLFSTSIIIFLIGLVSEQITTLMYKQ